MIVFRRTVFGKIIKRYKRFLADIELPTGEMIVAHVANTGSMKTCWEPGWKVMLTKSDNPERKIPYSLEIIHNGKTWIGVNTSHPNKIVKAALENKQFPELGEYEVVLPEFKIGKSRLDFCLQSKSQGNIFIEVKNVTLIGNNNDYRFPDAVSERGQKHLTELMDLKSRGFRTIMFYLIQREDAEYFTPASDIDPTYAKLLQDAHKVGVEIMAYECSVGPEQINIKKKVPCKIMND